MAEDRRSPPGTAEQQLEGEKTCVLLGLWVRV